MIRILNAEPRDYSPAARRILESVGELREKTLSRAGLIAEIGGFDVLITRLGHRIDREVIDAGRRLCAIVTATTELDHIDLDVVGRRGITVLSLKGETEFLRTVPASAELAWGLLLALTRRIPAAVGAVHRGEWRRDAFKGTDLAGKRLGLVGCGRIGEKTARYGRAFGMTVKTYDPWREKLPGGVGRAESLSALLAAADVITIHVPLTPETKGLLGAQELATVKPGALLVNIARGAVLVEAAVLEGLESGRLAGAALDVLCAEADLDGRPDHPLIAYARTHDNLLITPHIGGVTDESMAKTEVFMAAKLRDFLAKEAA